MSRSYLKLLFLSVSTFCVPVAAQAQSQDFGLTAPPQIETQALDAAQDFDAGVLTEGALDAGLWQGTSAARAAKLLSTAPLKSTDPVIRDIVRTVILSGGVPPQANDASGAQAYEAARLQAVLALESNQSGDTSTLDGFLARNPDLARSPIAQVDLALSKGNWQRACEISDTVTSERAQPQWARLRATCHALRGETSAADVTRDLLRSSGYDNPAYHAQMDALLSGRGPAPQQDQTDALVTFLASRGKAASEASDDVLAGGDADLSSVFKSFAATDLEALKSALGNISFDVSQPDLDLETAMASSDPRATARLFILGQAGDAAAMDAFISRAVREGLDEDVVLTKLTPVIQALPAAGRVNANLSRYTRGAIISQDIGSLQQLFLAMPEGAAQGRIALIADAMGGGFTAQDLGRDIEGRLAEPVTRAQAVVDSQIALALGARLSDAAADVLGTATLPAMTLRQNQLLLLDAAVRSNSRAETSLRAATLLAKPNLNVTDKARIIEALTQAGLPQFAGQIAAEVFFEGLTPAA